MSEARAVVVYESMYGNTRAVAEAIAAGLGAVAVPVHEASPAALAGAGLIVVGGPTHMHGMASSKSRELALSAARDDGIEPDPSAQHGPTLRAWLADLPSDDRRAAAFDTRLDKPPLITGVAARAIARRLRRRGFDVARDHASFVVEDSEGPLAEGELERAREWGAELAAGLDPAAPATT